MPTDLANGPRDGIVVVSDRNEVGLPFSKGIMATSILATGIETLRAHQVASLIGEELKLSAAKQISSEMLTEVAFKVLEEQIGTEVAQRYAAWRSVRRIGRPIVICLSGGTGIGKSTLSTRLALRLGINRIITTDAIREVLRTVIPSSVLPELHCSTFEGIDDRVQGENYRWNVFRRQAQSVVAAVGAVADRYVKEKRSVILEGVHIIPGFLTNKLKGLEEKPIVIEFLLVLEDEERHKAQLLRRSSHEPSRVSGRYIENFLLIRELQKELRIMARETSVPEFDITHPEVLTGLIVQKVVEICSKEAR